MRFTCLHKILDTPYHSGATSSKNAATWGNTCCINRETVSQNAAAWNQNARHGTTFLIRAAQNRNTKTAATLKDIQPLFSAIRQTPCQGQFTLALQRTPRRAARDTNLSIRFTHL